MNQATLRFPDAWTWTPILKRIATNLGLSVEPLESIFPITHVGLIRDRSIWMEMPMGNWMVCFRIIPQLGQPVIAEMRIFPGNKGKRKFPPGQWPGMYGDRAHVPPGGITTTFLHGITKKEIRAALRAIHNRHKEYLPESLGPLVPPAHQPPGKRGRKGRTDEELARIAETYEKAFLDNRPATKAVAVMLKVTISKARDAIHRARTRGFLSPAIEKGRGGGAMTLLGRQILKQPMKGASHAKKR
jgi:hypothetical protein